MEEEVLCLNSLVEGTEDQAITAEVTWKTLEIDLSTRYQQWLERGEVIGRLEGKAKELEVLCKEKDEVTVRISQQLAEHQATLNEAAQKVEDAAVSAQTEDLQTFAKLEAELLLQQFPDKDPEKGVFVESLASSVPRVSELANGWLDYAIEAQFNNSVCFFEGFLRCHYQIEALQKALVELDDSLVDEPSDEEFLKDACH